jgi:hypothetical protein
MTTPLSADLRADTIRHYFVVFADCVLRMTIGWPHGTSTKGIWLRRRWMQFSGAFLFDHDFRRPPQHLWNIGSVQHCFLGVGILLPADSGLKVHRAEPPPLHRILDAHSEAPELLIIPVGEPVFNEDDARASRARCGRTRRHRLPSSRKGDHGRARDGLHPKLESRLALYE